MTVRSGASTAAQAYYEARFRAENHHNNTPDNFVIMSSIFFDVSLGNSRNRCTVSTDSIVENNYSTAL